MAEDSNQEKTEEATPKKRDKAREEGQVAKSMEIPSVFIMLSACGILYVFAYFIYQNMLSIMRHTFSFDEVPDLTISYVTDLLYKTTFKGITSVLPLMLVIVLTALITNFMQVGFKLSAKAMMPKLSKFNVISGVAKMFSKKTAVELIKSIFKIIIIGAVSYFCIMGDLEEMIHLFDTSVGHILVFTLKASFKLFIWVVLVMTFIAILDFMFQKYQHEEQIKMTKQEVKDEYKQTEGDPMVKSRIRTIQAQASRQRMMQDVPDADVVVTNPTHLAIAIKYDPAQMPAPLILAKGAGLIAQRIKKLAIENDVPVVENKELAQNLYKIIDVGDAIPSEFFLAVAEILAYVYKMKGKTMQ